eukprot:UN06267
MLQMRIVFVGQNDSFPDYLAESLLVLGAEFILSCQWVILFDKPLKEN